MTWIRPLAPRLAAVALLAGALLTPSALVAQTVHSLPPEDLPLGGTPEELFSIGALDGEPWEVLSRVRAVGFDDEANLYVLDSDARVLKFGPDGGFVRQIGRKGQGPGEINLPLTMGVGGDGTVVVVDPSAGYHVFGPDGEHDRTVRPAAPAFAKDVVLAGDALIVPGGTRAAMQAGREGRDLPVFRQPLRDGAGAELIHEADVPPIEISVTPGAGGQSTFTFRRPPLYAPSLKIAAAEGGGVALVSGTDWRIDVLSASGSRLASLERRLPGRPSTDRDREVVQARMREAEASGGASRAFGGPPPAGLRRSRGAVEIAPTIPTVRALRGDGAGTLFVARETNPVGAATPPIDVVSVGGEYLGTLSGQELPVAFGPDRRAAYVETDELGVERVVVRRLPRSWFAG